MKLRNLFFAALSVFAFAACIETPEAPYKPGGNTGDNGGNDSTTTNGFAYIDETFATSLGAFKTVETVGNFAWKHEVYQNNGYAKVSGFANSASQDAESWLIAPAIDLSNETKAYISFDYVINKGDVDAAATNHKVVITDEYTGDVKTTEWTEIDFGAENNNNWTFHNTGNVELPALMIGSSNVVIAFKYISSTETSSTWEMNNLKVTGEVGAPEAPNTPNTPNTPVTPPTGENILENSSFEEWNGSNPTAWGSGNTGHNATISQSTEAYEGSYAVIVSGATTNKRLGSKSYTLSAGKYTIAAYIKQSGSKAGAFKLGYGIIKNGAIANADYKYQDNATTVTNEWELYKHEFTLAEETVIAALVMNSKVGNGAAILVDNVTLTTNDGGITGGGNNEGDEEEPETPAETYNFTVADSITTGKYLIVAGNNQATALDASKSYGYLPVTTVTPENGTINTTETNAFSFEAVEGGYSIKDSQGRYLYMKGEYNSVNLDTTLPSEGGVWTVEINADGTAKITNTYNNKVMQYDSQYNSYGIYSDLRGEMPTLYKKN